MNKNITTKTFSTFITTLKEELKGGYSLVKFQHKVGFFCGILSNDTEVSKEYKDALNAIDPEAKDFVLQKVMVLLDKPEARSYQINIDTTVELSEDRVKDIKDAMIDFAASKIDEHLAEDVHPRPISVEQLKPKRTRKSKAKVEE